MKYCSGDAKKVCGDTYRILPVFMYVCHGAKHEKALQGTVVAMQKRCAETRAGFCLFLCTCVTEQNI